MVDGAGKRDRPWIVLGGIIAVVLAGLGTSTCGLPPSSVDTCDDPSDCKPNSGAICKEGICTCPHNGEAFCMGSCRPAQAVQCAFIAGARRLQRAFVRWGRQPHRT